MFANQFKTNSDRFSVAKGKFRFLPSPYGPAYKAALKCCRSRESLQQLLISVFELGKFSRELGSFACYLGNDVF
jgi:hypothetical protein